MQTTEDEWGAGVSPLFSTEAPHNAEVMQDDEFRTVDQLWSVESTESPESPDSTESFAVQESTASPESSPTDATPSSVVADDEIPVSRAWEDEVETVASYDEDDSVIVEAEIVEDSQYYMAVDTEDDASAFTDAYGDTYADTNTHDYSSDDSNVDNDDYNNVAATPSTDPYNATADPYDATVESDVDTPIADASGLFGSGHTDTSNESTNFGEASSFTESTGYGASDPWVADTGPTDWSSPDPNLYDSDGTFVGGGVFSSEPIHDDGDVIDSVEDFYDDEVVEPDEEPWIPHHLQATGSQLFGGLANPIVHDDDFERTRAGATSSAAPYTTATGDPWVTLEDTDTNEPLATEISGSFDDAVERLSIDEQNRVEIPLVVCGSLLGPEEFVHGVVGGQMLGQPAVIVVTNSRVLVVNARRWRPIVDEYAVDGSLIVRGRHDKDVAALSFADPEKFSMVDDITDVELAIELADQIRSG